MSPNGRRAWREWVRRQNLRHKYKQPKGSVCRMARQARRHIPLVPGVMLPKPLTARSLVGMTMGARKRAAGMTMGARKRAARLCLGCIECRHEIPDVDYGIRCDSSGAFARASTVLRSKYHIGERLRPCPGCCACWGHRISSAYGEIAECCGPQTSGKRKSQIKAMRKWQETLADNCDGSGVLPARRS